MYTVITGKRPRSRPLIVENGKNIEGCICSCWLLLTFLFQTSSSSIVPSLQDRQAFVTRARRDPTSPSPFKYPSTTIYFTDENCLAVIRAVLKQLSEKLDIVRECAGTVFEDLITSVRPRTPTVPEKGALEAALRGATVSSGGEGGDHINWASPAMTFPIVVKAMSLESYHEVRAFIFVPIYPYESIA